MVETKAVATSPGINNVNGALPRQASEDALDVDAAAMEEVLLIDAMLRREDFRQREQVGGESSVGNQPDVFQLDSNFNATSNNTIAVLDAHPRNIQKMKGADSYAAYTDDVKVAHKHEAKHRKTTQALFPSHRGSRDVAEIQSSKKQLYSGENSSRNPEKHTIRRPVREGITSMTKSLEYTDCVGLNRGVSINLTNNMSKVKILRRQSSTEMLN